MSRPPSIVRFEQLYWASTILGWINTALQWSTAQAAFASNPVLSRQGWMLPTTTLASVAIAFLLWYFIARQASVVAKWVQVVFAAFAALSILSAVYFFAVGNAPPLLPSLLGIVANLLYVGAAVLLFRPDARAWFGEEAGDAEAPLA